MKIDKHIEIIRPSIKGLSSMGLKSCDMIISLLSKHYSNVGMTIVNDKADLDALISMKPDLAFLGMKNLPNEEGTIWLAEYLSRHDINYTGSGWDAITLDNDKPLAKQVVAASGLKTAPYFMASPGEYTDTLPLPFPLFVKPPTEGGGKGIGADSVVRTMEEFTHKVASLCTLPGSRALVEGYLNGREFSVGILGKPHSDKLTAMPIELITEKNDAGDQILGQKVKAADTEHAIAVHDQKLKRKLETFALAVFTALDARDYGRIDIRLDSYGTLHFLEANLIPGLAHHDFISYFTTACWINKHMDYDAMILNIVELALSRSTTSTTSQRPTAFELVTA